MVVSPNDSADELQVTSRSGDGLVDRIVDGLGDRLPGGMYRTWNRTAESASLILGHATPDTVLLACLQCVIEAVTTNRAPAADGTGVGGVGTGLRKEEVRIGGAATSGVCPGETVNCVLAHVHTIAKGCDSRIGAPDVGSCGSLVQVTGPAQ